MFNDTKYTLTYHKIVEVSRQKNRIKTQEIYYEKHHIIPKSLGGGNDKENLVLLTPREHFLLHWLLTKMVDEPEYRRKMHNAFYRLSHSSKFNNKRKLTPKQYAICKLSAAKAQLGKKHSQSTIQKRTKSVIESWKDADQRREEMSIRMSKQNSGAPKQDKTKSKISHTLTGVKHPEWRNQRKSERQKKTWILTFSSGNTITIDDLKSWCEKNNYRSASISNLKAGRIKYHKDIIDARMLP